MLHFVVSLSNSQGGAATQQITKLRSADFAILERIVYEPLH